MLWGIAWCFSRNHLLGQFPRVYRATLLRNPPISPHPEIRINRVLTSNEFMLYEVMLFESSTRELALDTPLCQKRTPPQDQESRIFAATQEWN